MSLLYDHLKVRFYTDYFSYCLNCYNIFTRVNYKLFIYLLRDNFKGHNIIVRKEKLIN